MFESRIQNTKLAGPLADCMFRHINGCNYEEDVSFVSTLRALLMSRTMGENRIEFKTFSFDLNQEEAALTTSLSSCFRPGVIAYVNVASDIALNSDDAKQKFFAFPSPQDVHEFVDVREFFASKMSCRAFIQEESKSAVILVLNSNMKKHHLAQCIIPKLLPWYFDCGRVSVMERKLLYSLRERIPGTYLAVLDAMCDTDDFRQRSASAALSFFKRKSLERQKTNVELTLKNRQDVIDRYNDDLLHELRLMNEDNFKLNGILIALESDDNTNDELAEFMTDNRSVDFVGIDGDYATLIIKGYLDVYDPEAYRSLARNPNCWYWSGSATFTGPFMQRENRKLVMDAIFGSDPVFKIKSYGVYRLNLDYGEVSVMTNYNSGLPQLPADRYENPHLSYAGCLGSYRPYINKALQRGDLVGAISQCISSAHSVNVTESATFGHLCQDIFRNNAAILEGPNGQSYTVAQAYEYLITPQNNQQTEGE